VATRVATTCPLARGPARPGPCLGSEPWGTAARPRALCANRSDRRGLAPESGRWSVDGPAAPSPGAIPTRGWQPGCHPDPARTLRCASPARRARRRGNHAGSEARELTIRHLNPRCALPRVRAIARSRAHGGRSAEGGDRDPFRSVATDRATTAASRSQQTLLAARSEWVKAWPLATNRDLCG
jgi:hypothetical protein